MMQPIVLKTFLDICPLIAILRGLTPSNAAAVAECLLGAGFTVMEVPLNSPNPYESIATISKYCGELALVGAGTVTSCEQVEQVAEAGGKIIVSPNCNTEVIRHSKRLGLISAPGCCTPSEAFAAIEAGADAIKLFPAEMIPPAAIKAMRAMLPLPLLAVGGINAGNMGEYLRAGVDGFGIGSSLFRADKSLGDTRRSAETIVSALRAIQKQSIEQPTEQPTPGYQ
jgi:2-dehydro-3-deoxyphosphogalactonate aldolase